jgi:diaminopimelate decarboxylase
VRHGNLGGGFGIPYSEKDVPLDLAAVADNLAGLVARPFARELPQARPVIELGRFLIVRSAAST